MRRKASLRRCDKRRSSRRCADDRQTVGLRAKREGAIVCGHDEILSRHFLPQKGGREMNRIERPELCRHWLCRPIKHDGVDFYEVEGRDQLQDCGATTRNLRVSEACAQAKAL